MRRIIVLFVFLLLAFSVKAQIMRVDELEKYAKENYGAKWNEAAKNLGSTIMLDKNNCLSYVQVVECPGKTKEQLYVDINYWVTATFADANSVIKLNDKETGTIICQGYMENIATHESLFRIFNVSIRPIIKIDIKAGKIRITYTVQSYDLEIFTSSMQQGVPPIRSIEQWTLSECYPFVEKDSHIKTSSKALIMTHAYSSVIMDKIEEAAKNGIVGNEDDDW